MAPKGLVCYVCGREFGLSSIAIHEPQCLKKWEVENSKLPRNKQRPAPQKPTIFPSIGSADSSGSQNDRQRFNQAAYESAKSQLIPCSKCGRTFAPDRIDVHENSCKVAGGSKIPQRTVGQRTETIDQEENSSGYSSKNSSNTPQDNGKPRTVVCYICGREFGSKSIDIHEPQCLKKWEVQNSNQPKELRRPKPVKPEFGSEPMSRDQMNEAAWEASKAQLVPCPNCGRRFAPDRLPVHLRSCKPKPGQQPVSTYSEPSYEKKSKSQPPPGPVYVICFICGRKYGSQSIEIHEPQCLEKWKIENDKLPRNLRRPPPVKPVGQSISSGGGYDYDAMNEAAWQASKQQLLECENCGRRFQPERLMVHQKSCRPGNTAKRIGVPQNNTQYEEESYNEPAPQKPGKPGPVPQPRNSKGQPTSVDSIPIPPPKGRNPAALYNNVVDNSSGPLNLRECPNCGRNFAADRLEVHVNACTGQKKRKVFDVRKMRVQGTEAESYLRKKKPAAEPKVKPNNWRQKHEEFVSAIRYAKMAGAIEKSGGSLANLPPPPASTNPDYIQCPYCMRRFSQMAGERHIPKCKDTVNKPKAPPGVRGGNQGQMGRGNPPRNRF